MQLRKGREEKKDAHNMQTENTDMDIVDTKLHITMRCQIFMYTFTNETHISFWCSAAQQMRNGNTIQPALAMLGIQKM